MVAGETRTALLALELFSSSRAWGSPANKMSSVQAGACFSVQVTISNKVLPYQGCTTACRTIFCSKSIKSVTHSAHGGTCCCHIPFAYSQVIT